MSNQARKPAGSPASTGGEFDTSGNAGSGDLPPLEPRRETDLRTAFVGYPAIEPSTDDADAMGRALESIRRDFPPEIHAEPGDDGEVHIFHAASPDTRVTLQPIEDEDGTLVMTTRHECRDRDGWHASPYSAPAMLGMGRAGLVRERDAHDAIEEGFHSAESEGYVAERLRGAFYSDRERIRPDELEAARAVSRRLAYAVNATGMPERDSITRDGDAVYLPAGGNGRVRVRLERGGGRLCLSQTPQRLGDDGAWKNAVGASSMAIDDPGEFSQDDSEVDQGNGILMDAVYNATRAER
jgi:hypothetical protein